MTTSPAVLVVGAGPTGLLLALSLARRGVPVRVVDRKRGPTEQSRAIVVQARTLELYAQLGLAQDVVAQGIPVRSIHVLQPGHGESVVDVQDVGHGLSPFSHLLCYPQDTHEKLLVTRLHEAGVEVEWLTELTGVTQGPDDVEASLRGASGEVASVRVPYVVGCDGGHSQVRESLGIAFEGGSYERLYFVADARITGADARDIRLSFDARILGLCFPVRPGEARILGVVPAELVGRSDLTFEDVRAEAESLLRIKVEHLNWFSTFRVHHRVAERFRSGRCFLAGDAGHVHSPVGGQGMNTGLGDAFNLSWKLAEVVHGRADPAIVDSYEPERLPFARRLVATTDAVFQQLIGQGLGGQLARAILPRVAPLALDVEAIRRSLFQTISQVKIAYHDSPLSEGVAGDLRGGDRLPWLRRDDVDNFAPLTDNAWQLHVLGELSPEMSTTATSLGLPVHVFQWGEDAETAGFQRNAGYLVRPDGYLGLVLPHQEPAALRGYVTRQRLRFGAGAEV